MPVIHEFHVIDLSETGQIQLRVVDGDSRIESTPVAFSVALQASDQRELDWYFLESWPEPQILTGLKLWKPD